MSAFDGNHDGHMSTKERVDQMEFRYGDRDDDGVMNRKEFAHCESKIE
jgi:Ca2+-binding EF-hand superfamily protein